MEWCDTVRLREYFRIVRVRVISVRRQVLFFMGIFLTSMVALAAGNFLYSLVASPVLTSADVNVLIIRGEEATTPFTGKISLLLTDYLEQIEGVIRTSPEALGLVTTPSESWFLPLRGVTPSFFDMFRLKIVDGDKDAFHALFEYEDLVRGCRNCSSRGGVDGNDAALNVTSVVGSAVVGKTIASLYGISVGDSLVLLSTTTNLVQIVQVIGVFESGTVYDQQILTSLEVAQSLFDMPSDVATLIQVQFDPEKLDRAQLNEILTRRQSVSITVEGVHENLGLRLFPLTLRVRSITGTVVLEREFVENPVNVSLPVGIYTLEFYFHKELFSVQTDYVVSPKEISEGVLAREMTLVVSSVEYYNVSVEFRSAGVDITRATDGIRVYLRGGYLPHVLELEYTEIEGNGSGVFVDVPYLRPGMYTLELQYPGVNWTQSFSVSSNRNVTVVLDRAMRVVAKNITSSQQLIENASVVIENLGNGRIWEGTTTVNGSVLFYVYPGIYRINVTVDDETESKLVDVGVSSDMIQEETVYMDSVAVNMSFKYDVADEALLNFTDVTLDPVFEVPSSTNNYQQYGRSVFELDSRVSVAYGSTVKFTLNSSVVNGSMVYLDPNVSYNVTIRNNKTQYVQWFVIGREILALGAYNLSVPLFNQTVPFSVKVVDSVNVSQPLSSVTVRVRQAGAEFVNVSASDGWANFSLPYLTPLEEVILSSGGTEVIYNQSLNIISNGTVTYRFGVVQFNLTLSDQYGRALSEVALEVGTENGVLLAQNQTDSLGHAMFTVSKVIVGAELQFRALLFGTKVMVYRYRLTEVPFGIIEQRLAASVSTAMYLRIEDLLGRPYANLHVYLSQEIEKGGHNITVSFSSWTDRGGMARFGGVPLGDYRLEVLTADNETLYNGTLMVDRDFSYTSESKPLKVRLNYYNLNTGSNLDLDKISGSYNVVESSQFANTFLQRSFSFILVIIIVTLFIMVFTITLNLVSLVLLPIQQHANEIFILKCLGASDLQIVIAISFQFSLSSVIASLLSILIAYPLLLNIQSISITNLGGIIFSMRFNPVITLAVLGIVFLSVFIGTVLLLRQYLAQLFHE